MIKHATNFILVFLLIFTPLSARKVKVDLSESKYGLEAANRQGLLSSRLRIVLDSIHNTVNADDEVVILLPKKAVWQFHSTDAAQREVYISNHDQDQPKRTGIWLEGWKNLTIDGRGTEILCHGRMLPLSMVGTTNCTIKNLRIDFANPQIAQVEIVSNKGEEGITFRAAPWVKHRINSAGAFEVYGEGWAQTPYTGIAFEKDSRHIVYRTSDLEINLSGLTCTGKNTYHAPNWKDERLKPTTIVALRSYYRPHPGIFLADNKQTTLRKVTVHYAEGMGLIVQRQEDITLNGFNVCLRGKDDPRYFTTQADATHFSQCKGKIVSIGGLYEGMMDDAINVHGVYLKVIERIDDRTLRLAYGHGQTWGFAWGDAGDTIRFIKSKEMQYLDNAYTLKSIRPADQSEVKGCKEFIATFNERLPLEIKGEGTYGVENMNWTPTVHFKGNTIRNNRARGALFSSPRRTVCEKNLFDHTSGSAIVLCGDCNGWYESGACYDLVIRKNKFINALTNLFQFTNAVISIYPEVPAISRQTKPLHGGKLGSIVIEKNLFDTFDTPLLYAKSVSGLRFINNKVVKNTDYQPFHFNQEPVLFEHTVNSEAPGYQPVKLKNTVK